MAIEINHIPREILHRFNARQAVVLAAGHLGDEVQITTSLSPEDLHGVGNLSSLTETRKRERVESITMTILKLDNELIGEATSYLANRFRVISELDTLLRYEEEVFVVYVITHFNPGHKPLGPLTVNIGGDCHRTGRSIRDLQSILDRTRDLAEAMVRKAVMIFPDIPALHGGKKGEWIILDRDGRKIEGLSEDAIIALGSAIIPKGIHFLNRYKERWARQLKICDGFPERNYVKPDSGSPDVLSGIYWRGENPDKHINMCKAWHERGHDMAEFTCLPPKLGGTLDPSARPTGYGVATTAATLAERYFARRGKKLQKLRFLLEAAGGVGRNTVEALIDRYGVPAANVTVFDRNQGACNLMSEKYRVEAIPLRHDDFYQARLPEDVRQGKHYDVWVNNGEGSNTRPEFVANLLDAGVRVFAGGANNFLEVATERESLGRIFDAGGWAWPDAATSGGGWTLAVIDVLTRCQGREANSQETRERILEIIDSRNRKLVSDVLDALPAEAGGREVWERVEELIDERVRRTLKLELDPEEIYRLADTRHWQMT